MAEDGSGGKDCSWEPFVAVSVAWVLLPTYGLCPPLDKVGDDTLSGLKGYVSMIVALRG
jgi:hypothetical protein